MDKNFMHGKSLFSPKKKPKIFLVGNDAMLSYLIKRYAEQLDYGLENANGVLLISDIIKLNPSHIIFTSLTILKESRDWVTTLDDMEIQILVCSGIGEEVSAREYGADFCLIHPFTFDDFQKAIL